MTAPVKLTKSQRAEVSALRMLASLASDKGMHAAARVLRLDAEAIFTEAGRAALEGPK